MQPYASSIDSTSAFEAAVVGGFNRHPRELPSQYLYDARGSQLFDEISQLREYYPTRAELEIMRRHVHEMAEQIGPRVMLVEFGSGSSIKTRVLLRALVDPVAYVPLDISREHLLRAATELQTEFRRLEVLPLVADFTKRFTLPKSRREPSHRAVYFPGSTIGNLTPDRGSDLLRRIGSTVGANGGLLIGFDLQKDPGMIEAAYNDSRGVTAAFNKNLLHRINRELGGTFDSEAFSHRAIYNAREGRVEISLVSNRNQRVRVGPNVYYFANGEAILTEYSYKYTVNGFAEWARHAGFTPRRFWTDARELFAVGHLVYQPAATWDRMREEPQ